MVGESRAWLLEEKLKLGERIRRRANNNGNMRLKTRQTNAENDLLCASTASEYTNLNSIT